MIAAPRDALYLERKIFEITGHGGLPGLRFILLNGVSSIEESGAVSKAHNTEVRSSIGFEGLDVFGLECVHLDGIHLWLDAGLYEIISDINLARESQETDYKPLGEWLWESKRGITGELVITNFNEVMPLIRYRTGIRVEYAGSECLCGRTHPRIKMI